MRFSIVVPVYNVEAYLMPAVNSVLSQSFDDYEIILVDDGSPDNSPRICDDLAAAHSNVRVIHKCNGGSSDARNVGTEAARGEYILYLDSDDKWIDNDALINLSKLINEFHPHVIVFGVEDYDSITNNTRISRGNYDERKLNSSSSKDVINELLAKSNFPGAAWMMATKKDLLINHDIKFLEGVSAEDFDWIIKVITNADSIKALDRVIYQYRYNSVGSITSKPRLSGVMGIHNAIKNWLNSEYNSFPEITNYLCRIFFQGLLNYSGLSKEDKRNARKVMMQDSEILKKSNSMNYKLSAIAFSLFGIGIFSSCIRTARNLMK